MRDRLPGVPGDGVPDEGVPDDGVPSDPVNDETLVLRNSWTDRLGLPLLVIGAALVAVFASSPGWYIADARLEHSLNPWQFLQRHQYLWDAERSLGKPLAFFSPVVAGVQSLLAGIGFAPWVVERFTHAIYLSLAGIGTIRLTQHLAPGQRLLPALAAFLYAFNPYTTQFLTPSGLFLPYALAPWFALFALRGTEVVGGTRSDRADRPWRYAASFALTIFCVGLLNTASLVYSLMPSAVLLVAAIFHQRTATIRSVWSWLWRTSILTMGVSGAMLVVLYHVLPEVAVNLQTTEKPETVAQFASAGESWRGLGLWISYLRLNGAALRPQVAGYFTNPLIILSTFVPVAFAAVGLRFGQVRYRVSLGFSLVIGVIVMSAYHQPDDPSPLGSLVGYLYSDFNITRSFRSAYKIGAAVQLGVSILAAAGVIHLFRTWASLQRWNGRALRSVGGVVVVAALLLSAFPYWTGNLYNEADGFQEMPDYWEDVFDWFDERPEGRVLVLPGVSRARYTWGYVNDNLFESRLKQTLVMRQSLPQGTPLAASLVAEIETLILDELVSAEALGDLLAELGIDWVVIQNDLDHERLGTPRPEQFDHLRSPGALRNVGVFGLPGENISSGLGLGTQLHPVEVFRVTDRAEIEFDERRPLVVSGGGDSVAGLAEFGLLDQSGVYTATADESKVRSLLRDGAGAVITDGGRRQATRVTTSRNRSSHTLALGEDVGREPQALNGDAEYQTVSSYGAASTVTASRYGGFEDAWNTTVRPGLAVDGVDESAWVLTGDQSTVGETLTFDFAVPVDLRTIRIQPYAANASARRITLFQVTATAGDGTETVVWLDNQGTVREPRFGGEVEFDATMRVEVEILSEWRFRNTGVGIAEVSFGTPDGPLDISEGLRTPIDLEQHLREGDPVSYVFSAEDPVANFTDDLALRRTFFSPGLSDLGAEVVLRLSSTTPDRVVAELRGSQLNSWGDTRWGNTLASSGVFATDGDPTTAWEFEPTGQNILSVNLPEDIVYGATIDVAVLPDELLSYSRARRVEVDFHVDGEITTIETRLPARTRCAADVTTPLGDGCVERLRVMLDEPVVTEHISVRFVSSDVRLGLVRARPIRVTEVTPVGPFTDYESAELHAADDSCRPLLRINDAELHFRLAIFGDDGELRPTSRATSCDTIDLASGSQQLELVEAAHGSVRHAWLRSDATAAELRIANPSVIRSTITEISPVRHRIDVQPDGPGWIRTDIPSHAGWRLRDAPSGAALVNLDGMVGIELLAAGDYELDLRFSPNGLYRVGLLVSLLSVMACIGIVVWGRPQPVAVAPMGSVLRIRQRNPVLLLVVLGGIGFLLMGILGLLLGGVIGALLTRRPRLSWPLATCSVLAISAMTVLEVAPTAERVGRFAGDRPLTHAVALLALVAWISALLLIPTEANYLIDQNAVPEPGRIRRRVYGWVEGWGEFARSKAQYFTTSSMAQGQAWMLGSTLAVSLGSFVFWVLAARTTSPDAVGRASALFSSTFFLTYVTSLGLPVAIGRFAPSSSRDHTSLYRWSIFATVVTSLVGSALFAVVAPNHVLEPLLGRGGFVGFLVLFGMVAGVSISTLVDVRLMGLNRYSSVFWRTVGIAVIRLPVFIVISTADNGLVLFLVATGAYAITGLAYLPSGWRSSATGPILRPLPEAAVEFRNFAAVNYVSQLSVQAPFYVTPMLVLLQATPAENAEFYLAWGMMSVVFIGIQVMGRALLVEGGRSVHERLHKSQVTILIGLLVAAGGFVGSIVLGALVVQVYGSEYSGLRQLLPLLVAGTIPWAVTSVALAISRIEKDTRATLYVTLGYALSVISAVGIGLAVADVTGAAWGWLAGNVIALAGAIPALRTTIASWHSPTNLDLENE